MAYLLTQNGRYISGRAEPLSPGQVDELSDFSFQPAPQLAPVPLQSITEPPLAVAAAAPGTPAATEQAAKALLDSPIAWLAGSVVAGHYLGLFGGAAVVGAAYLFMQNRGHGPK